MTDSPYHHVVVKPESGVSDHYFRTYDIKIQRGIVTKMGPTVKLPDNIFIFPISRILQKTKTAHILNNLHSS